MSISLAIQLLIALIQNAGAISALITKAQSENRDITSAEIQSLLDNDALARAKLVVAIADAKAAGR